MNATWYKAHGHRQGEEERPLPIVLGETIDKENQRHHHGHKLHHEPGKAAEALVEARLRPFLGDRMGHAAQVGLQPRRDHNRRRRAALYARPHEAGVHEFGGGAFFLDLGIVNLLHRERFTGEAALAYEEVFGSQQAHVAWDHVPGSQVDDVPRHQVPKRYLPRRAVPNHCSGDVDHSLELLGGGVRPGFLPEAKSHTQHHHAYHYKAGTRVAGKERNGRQN